MTCRYQPKWGLLLDGATCVDSTLRLAPLLLLATTAEPAAHSGRSAPLPHPRTDRCPTTHRLAACMICMVILKHGVRCKQMAAEHRQHAVRLGQEDAVAIEPRTPSSAVCACRHWQHLQLGALLGGVCVASNLFSAVFIRNFFQKVPC